jgi:hypothetical protein
LAATATGLATTGVTTGALTAAVITWAAGATGLGVGAGASATTCLVASTGSLAPVKAGGQEVQALSSVRHATPMKMKALFGLGSASAKASDRDEGISVGLST